MENNFKTLSDMWDIEVLRTSLVDEYGWYICKVYEINIDDIVHILQLKSVEFERTGGDDSKLISIAIHALNNLKL